jgi:diguanylate cyclase (GGDEF)-like protein/PAS domain S-box-containing protein
LLQFNKKYNSQTADVLLVFWTLSGMLRNDFMMPPNSLQHDGGLSNAADAGPHADQHWLHLVQLAALACATPIAYFILFDGEQAAVMAGIGLQHGSADQLDFIPASAAAGMLCEFPDLKADAGANGKPAIAGLPDIASCAGIPINDDGRRIASLCVMDRVPRQLNQQQRDMLHALGSLAKAAIGAERAAEHALKKNQRLANIIDGTQVGTWEKNLVTGELRYNERWAQIVGYTLAELGPLTSRIWANLAHPADLDLSTECLNDHVRGIRERYEAEVRMRHKDGHWVWVLDSGTIMTRTANGDAEWMFGTLLDITERKHQEEALRKSTAILNRTGHLAGIGGWELDLGTNEVYFSEETCRIYGVPPEYRPSVEESIAGFTATSRPLIRAALDRAIASGEGWDLELAFVRKDGAHLWLRAVGSAEFQGARPVRLVGAFQDITERFAERLAIQSAKERISLATDSGAIGIWEYSPLDGTLTGDAWTYRLFGQEPQQQAQNPEFWTRKMHPEDYKKVALHIRAILEERETRPIEYRIYWPDGSLHHVQTSARVTRDLGGRVVGLVGTAIDVTESRQLTANLARQHELLSVTLRSIADAVITTDETGRIAWLNPVAERMTGWAAPEATGMALEDVFQIVNEETREPANNPVKRCLELGDVVGVANHTVLISRNGAEFGIEDSAAPIRNDNGEVLGAVLVFRDVTEQRRLTDEMSFRATHDTLTGLINRPEFETQLARHLQSAQNEADEHVLLFLDLDQFKLVNDACGHAMGDQLLQQVAKLLGEAVRSRDILARLGGDEFGILLEHCTAEKAVRVAQDICDRMEDFRFVHDERRFRIGASIGLVPIDSRWTSTEAILQAADTSCYAAKEAGRNRVHVWFDKDVTMLARHGEMQWTTRIEQALDEDRFVLFAQRISPLRGDHDTIHAEVLLRMVDTDGSLIPPGAFLPAAERFHLASRVDRWVVKKVIAWMSALPTLKHVVNISVNLSGQSVGDKAFHRWAIEVMENAGPAICTRLCFEITETAAVTNLADATVFFEHVRERGVRVALDDFGAGASSFGYLKKFPVDYLKIDGQFVRDLLTDSLDEAAVRCFTDVAKVVSVKTVAEFVEVPAVLDRLREMGVDFAQGYLLHKPSPINDLLLRGEAQAVPMTSRRLSNN